MVDIKPISNEDNLLHEVDSVATHKPHIEQPFSQTPEVSSKNSNNETKRDKKSPSQFHNTAPNIDKGETFRRIPDSDTIIKAIDNAKKPFAYRLPVFGYVISWFYLIVIALIAIVLIQYFILMNGVPTNSLYHVNSYSGLFGALSPNIFVLVYCMAMVSIILSNRKILRYLGILFSTVAIGFQIYIIIRFISELQNSRMITSMLYFNITSYAIYVPFLLLPILTMVYLITPKASRAYNK
jgi:hypothetical protein